MMEKVDMSINLGGLQLKNPVMPASGTFDLEIFQKLASTATESVGKMRDCRFTRKGGGINKRGVLVEQFAFNAILMDNDADVEVGNSGDLDLQP